MSEVDWMAEVTLDTISEGLRRNVEELFRENDHERPGIELSPMLHFFEMDGTGGIALIHGDVPKPAVAAMARKMSKDLECYAVALITEAWATPVAGGERSEILLVTIDARNGRRILHWPIVREGAARRLGEMIIGQSKAGSGTLSDLLDPSLKEH